MRKRNDVEGKGLEIDPEEFRTIVTELSALRDNLTKWLDKVNGGAKGVLFPEGKDFHFGYDKKAKGYVCAFEGTDEASKVCNEDVFDIGEINLHLEEVHGVPFDEQVAEGSWTKAEEREAAEYVAKHKVRALRESRKPKSYLENTSPLGRTKASAKPSRVISLTDAQRLGLELEPRTVRIDRCPTNCPRLAKQNECTPENCIEIGKRRPEFREVFYVVQNNPHTSD